jgi:hypothetical protein
MKEHITAAHGWRFSQTTVFMDNFFDYDAVFEHKATRGCQDELASRETHCCSVGWDGNHLLGLVAYLDPVPWPSSPPRPTSRPLSPPCRLVGSPVAAINLFDVLVSSLHLLLKTTADIEGQLQALLKSLFLLFSTSN